MNISIKLNDEIYEKIEKFNIKGYFNYRIKNILIIKLIY